MKRDRRFFSISPSIGISSIVAFNLLFLFGCHSPQQADNPENFPGVQVKLLVGSALGDFCTQAAQQFNQQQPKLDNGTPFKMVCESAGSGDIVSGILAKAQQFKNGGLREDSPEFPTLIALDGEIYQNQLIYQMNQLFPGNNYIPAITDSPLIANTPMVFMSPANLAPGLQKVPDLYKAFVTAKNHRELDQNSPPININYVHSAPTRSNSGLQTLVAQYASVAGKRPEQLTVADVQTYQAQVQKIQAKITRYGVSTNALATSMVQNGPFWASVGSVYESSVIAANRNLQPNQSKFQAIYPQATFTSNMRMILPNSPWVSVDEKAAAQKVIAYLQSPAAQQIAVNLGLRPGTPGIPLGNLFSPELGVNPQAKYDSLRPPKPEVVEALLKSWLEVVKKPSQVVVVVDSSGSMTGNKLPAVQNTLLTYINSLGPKDQIALIDFDSEIRPPVLVDGTPAGRDRGIQFVNGLQVDGGTALYDAALYARNWLKQNLRKDAINAVLILTDGEDSGSKIQLDQLSQELQKSGFSSDQRIGFFTIGYGSEGEFNPDALQKIAQFNGGYYAKGDPETISRLMADLQVEF